MNKKKLCDWTDELDFAKIFEELDNIADKPNMPLYSNFKHRFMAGESNMQFAGQMKTYIRLLDIPENEVIISNAEPTSAELGLASFGLAEMLKGEITPENAAKMKEAWNRMREKIESDMNQKIDPKTTTDIFFERILGNDKLNKTDVYDIRNLLKANALIYPYQCLIVSALMLSLMRKYDENRIGLLIDALNENVNHVWQRALLALVMGLGGRTEKVQANTALTNRLRDLQTKPTVQDALLSIYKALYGMEIDKAFEKKSLAQKFPKYHEYVFFAESGKPQYWFLPFYDAPELLAFFEDREINLNHQKLINLLASPYEIALSDSNKYALCFGTTTLFDFQINRCFEILETEITKNQANKSFSTAYQSYYFRNLLNDIWYFRNYYPNQELAKIFEKQQLLHQTSLLNLLAKNSTQADFLFSQAFLLYIPSEKVKVYEQVLRLNPDKYEAWYNLGNAYANLKDYAQAIDAYRKAIKIKPDDNELWYYLGNVYDDLKDYAQAIDAYRKAIEIKPDFHEAWYNLGNVYLYLKDYEKAEQSYIKALEIKPDDVGLIYNLACMYSLQNHKEKAIFYLQKAISLNPEYQKDAQTDTDFEYFWEDADFKKIVT